MARSANVSVCSQAGLSLSTMNQIPSDELAIIANAFTQAAMNVVSSFTTPAVKPLRKGTSLATAMKAFGINNTTNAKGDTLISYHSNRPKYPFVFRSIRGARWKQTPEQAKRRFG